MSYRSGRDSNLELTSFRHSTSLLCWRAAKLKILTTVCALLKIADFGSIWGSCGVISPNTELRARWSCRHKCNKNFLRDSRYKRISCFCFAKCELLIVSKPIICHYNRSLAIFNAYDLHDQVLIRFCTLWRQNFIVTSAPLSE